MACRSRAGSGLVRKRLSMGFLGTLTESALCSTHCSIQALQSYLRRMLLMARLCRMSCLATLVTMVRPWSSARLTLLPHSPRTTISSSHLSSVRVKTPTAPRIPSAQATGLQLHSVRARLVLALQVPLGRVQVHWVLLSAVTAHRPSPPVRARLAQQHPRNKPYSSPT
jgi:hypothetical protein